MTRFLVVSSVTISCRIKGYIFRISNFIV